MDDAFESEMDRPRNYLARQIRQPTGGAVDNGQYDVLRPGIMLSSGRIQSQETLTSSGVLIVQDRLYNRYMTAVSHGFPHDNRLFHPLAGCKEIGKVNMEIMRTDVAIVKLHEKLEFVNETFENTTVGGDSVQLRKLARADETQIGT